MTLWPIYLPILWVGLDILNLFCWLNAYFDLLCLWVKMLHISLYANEYNYYTISHSNAIFLVPHINV